MISEHKTLAPIMDKIFRAYDIRGLGEEELNDAVVTRIAYAIAAFGRREAVPTVVIGCDARLSSPRIVRTLTNTLMQHGLSVIDIGQVPTPLLYYGAQQLSGFGVMVTASHNPKDDNGFKIVMHNRALSSEALHQLKQDALIDELPEPDGERGEYSQQDMITPYVEHVTKLHPCQKTLKVVVDAGNGIGGVVGPRLLEAMGCEVISLYCELDGRFPNHHPNPGDEHNLQDLITKVHEESADVGLAFDGDADRLGVVTNAGEIIRPDRLLMWYAEDLLKRQPGASIVYDIKCTRYLSEIIKDNDGTPVMWKTGHAHIKSKMRELKAPLAGEMSGHLFFGENWYGFDDACFAAAKVCQLLSQSELSSSECFKRFPNAVSTAEILMPVPDQEKFQLMDKLSAHMQFPEAERTTIDGLRLDFADGWGLIRASNTTANLSCRFEADNMTALARIMEQFSSSFQEVDSRIRLDVDSELALVPET